MKNKNALEHLNAARRKYLALALATPLLAAYFPATSNASGEHISHEAQSALKNGEIARDPADRAGAKITERIHRGLPIPINPNERLIWSLPNSGFTSQNVTQVVISEKVGDKVRYFQLESKKQLTPEELKHMSQAERRANIKAVPVPEEARVYTLPSKYVETVSFSSGDSDLPYIPNKEGVVEVNEHNQPFAVVQLIDDKHKNNIHVLVGVNEVLDSNVMVA